MTKLFNDLARFTEDMLASATPESPIRPPSPPACATATTR
jgi:hypothetical protein